MPSRPCSSNGHSAARKSANANVDLARLWTGNSGDGPVANKMQQVRIVSSAFLSSAFSKRPQSAKPANQEAKEELPNTKSVEDFQNCRKEQADSWDESSDTESNQAGSNNFRDSSTDDFQTESEYEASPEDIVKKDTSRPGASGDATNEHESVFQREQRNPLVRRDSSRIRDVLKTLQDTLKNVENMKTSETRPTTPTVCLPDPNNEEKLESRGSGDTYVGIRKCPAWAAWYVAKEKEINKKRQETREMMERQKKTEMEEQFLREERRNRQVIAFQQWLQRKEEQREAAEKERAMKLEELRQKENEQLLAMREASQRARTEWCKKKDRELKERRLQEEKKKAEAKEKEMQRRAVAEKRVREWRKLRAGPCALNEMPEEDEEAAQKKVPTSRPRRRTRREQDRICARLSRPSQTKIPATKESENVCKEQVSWVQRVKRRSFGTKRSEPATRCVSARPRSRENLELILSQSDYRSPASRTSDWIKSVISRRHEQESSVGGDHREKREIPEEARNSRSKSSAKALKPKNQIMNGSTAVKKDRNISKTEHNLKKRMETR